MAARFSKRLRKELRDLQSSPPEGVLVREVDDLTRWEVVVHGAPGTMYEGQEFVLQFKFGPQYPMESPEVMFIGSNIPLHPHIYSNGHICLSILYDNWSPALSVSAVCLSIQSMLSSNTDPSRPSDNDHYIRTYRGKSPKETSWWFHDDKV